MSETTTTPATQPVSTARDRLATWGAPVVSVLTLVIFCVAYLIAWRSADTQTQTLMAGAAISMATGAVNFWIGSSAGSQRKDDTIATQAASKPTP